MDNQEKIKRMWKYLNDEGIFTMEELQKRVKEMPKINIGIFVSPIRKEGLNC